MRNLTIGNKAPFFSLQDKDGKKHALNKNKADYIVLYFYPKDNTPGCTLEAKMFSNDLSKFNKLNSQVIGISGGDNKSKEKFCQKHDLKITLLSDQDFSISKKYGVFKEKKMMGRVFMGITRTTFVLDKDLKIVKIYKTVKPAIHSREVLDDISSLNK
ncbi:peroxiredoxin [Patescibacteria group bacterium]